MAQNDLHNVNDEFPTSQGNIIIIFLFYYVVYDANNMTKRKQNKHHKIPWGEGVIHGGIYMYMCMGVGIFGC